jgi:riboflavin synthase
MFTGIVEACGEVRACGAGRLEIGTELAESFRPGDSVAVDGACLTVTLAGQVSFGADVMPETLQRTTLAALRPGDAVNLERSLRAGDGIGGHIVTGHVDATGAITVLREDGNARWATITMPDAIARLVAEKGSVAVAGISLTVVDVFESAFTVSLIPHTLQHTTAGAWRPGTQVNLEADVLARYVQRALRADATLRQLSEVPG